MLRFHLKACPKCHGDLALDEGDWLCLQCGTYYYTRLYRNTLPFPVPDRRMEDWIEDRGEKAISLSTSAPGSLSRFPDLATTAAGRGGSRETRTGQTPVWLPERTPPLETVAREPL